MHNPAIYSLNRKIGRAAEHRVMAELLIRGFEPFMADLDSGVDILLSSGVKIQVKSAQKRTEKGNFGKSEYSTYVFNNRKRLYLNEKYVKRADRHSDNSKYDFMVGWCVDVNEFYVIPSPELPLTHIKIHNNDSLDGKYAIYKNAWHLLRRD